MTQILLVLLLLVQLPAHHNVDATLLESGKATTLKTKTTTPSEIKVISYNIRWRSGEDLKELTTLLREDPEIGKPLILGLQEVDRKKKRTGFSNVAKQMADELGMHYAWAAPPVKPGDEEETGVAILSVYPLSDLRRIVLPHEGPDRRRRVAIGATVAVDDRKWRVYSIHAETRISSDKRLDQFRAILEDLGRYPSDMPAIVMGDFNTWQANAERKTIKLFYEAGLRTPFDSKPTFKRRIVLVPIQFRLDWVWLRGLDAASYGIDRKVDVSDHWPLWTNVKLSSTSTSGSPKKQ